MASIKDLYTGFIVEQAKPGESSADAAKAAREAASSASRQGNSKVASYHLQRATILQQIASKERDMERLRERLDRLVQPVEAPTTDKVEESLLAEEQGIIELHLDPTRTDTHDVARMLMPYLVQTSYHHMLNDFHKHDRVRDHDDPEDKFDFTKSNLEDMVDNLAYELADRLKSFRSGEIEEFIDDSSSTFSKPLEG